MNHHANDHETKENIPLFMQFSIRIEYKKKEVVICNFSKKKEEAKTKLNRQFL